MQEINSNVQAEQNIENEYMNGECVRMDGGIRMQPR